MIISDDDYDERADYEQYTPEEIEDMIELDNERTLIQESYAGFKRSIK